MPNQRKDKPRNIYLGPELNDAIDAYLAARPGQTLAGITRELWAQKLGRPELANSVKMGRGPASHPEAPANAEEAAPKRRRKKPPA